jgi:uncharacterized protein YecT (DUF1311 family)
MDKAKKAHWSAIIVPVVLAISVPLLPRHSAHAEEDPLGLTAQGVISENVRTEYAREIDACYHEAGQSARGPRFLDCIRRHARSQEDALAAVFDARMSYLQASPELAASLQNSQTTWVQFREANCAYIRAIAQPSYADEAFQNCLLRTTIYRRVHLRWSVGD